MDKWVVNNYIVQMRSSVIQARVQTLNKLVREIRKLQNKKGSVQQKKKNQRKAERFKQEVFLIKKLEPDEVSKFALLVKEDPEEELKRVSISLEERAKMRIIAHKSVVQQVEIFRMKYTDWELKLPPLLVQLGLKNKYKNKSELHPRPSTSKPVTKRSVENDENENNVLEHSDHNSESISSVNESFLRNTTSSVNDGEKIKMTSNLYEEDKKSDKTFNKAEVHRIANLMKCDGNSQSSTECDKKLYPKKNTFCKGDEKKKQANSIAEISRFSDLMKSDGNSESSMEHEKKLNPRTNILCKGDEKKKQANSIAEIRRFADLIESDGNSESSMKHEIKLNQRTNTLCEGDEKKKEVNSLAEIRRFADLKKSDDNSECSMEYEKKLNPRKDILSKDDKKKKSNGLAEVCRFADLAGSDSSEESEDSKSEYEKLNPTNAAVDPFFLTGDDDSNGFDSDQEERNPTRIPQNSNRFSSFNNKRNQTFGRFGRFNSEGRASSRDNQEVPSLNRKQRRMLERAKAEKKGVSVSALIKDLFPKQVDSSVKTKFGRFPGQEDLKKENTSEKQESLHPSWEAKRKLKAQQILPFQGKKIKFDENDE